MIIDLSFDYDASFTEFKGPKVFEISKGDRWVSSHTDRGEEFLSTYLGKEIEINKPVRISNELYKKIMEDIPKELSSIIGGFHYK